MNFSISPLSGYHVPKHVRLIIGIFAQMHMCFGYRCPVPGNAHLTGYHDLLLSDRQSTHFFYYSTKSDFCQPQCRKTQLPYRNKKLKCSFRRPGYCSESSGKGRAWRGIRFFHVDFPVPRFYELYFSFHACAVYRRAGKLLTFLKSDNYGRTPC